MLNLHENRPISTKGRPIRASGPEFRQGALAVNPLTPLFSGHTGYGSTSLDLLDRTTALIEEVVAFRPEVRDFSAPQMSLASSLNAVPLADLRPIIDIQA